jgi:hypothetical protein
MRLDAALVEPDMEWLTIRAEKLAHLTARTEDVVHPTARTPCVGVDLFPGTFPIGVDSTGRLVLLYVAAAPWTDDFRVFLVGHFALLAVTARWTVRVVFPQSLQRAQADYVSAVHEELERPLGAAELNELRWYFFHRRRDDFATMGDSLRDCFTRTNSGAPTRPQT